MIKIDLDLPEFDKEISINIVIKKDGKIICDTSSQESSSSIDNNISRKISSFPGKPGIDTVKNVSPSINTSSPGKLIGGGNMMDISF